MQDHGQEELEGWKHPMKPHSPWFGADLPWQACSNDANTPIGCSHRVCIYSKQNVKEKIKEILGVPIELCFGRQWEEVRGVGPAVVSRRVSAPSLSIFFLSIFFKKWAPIAHLPPPTFSELLLLLLTLIVPTLLFFSVSGRVFAVTQ